MKGRPPAAVSALDVRPGFHQQRHRLGLAFGGGQVKRRLSEHGRLAVAEILPRQDAEPRPLHWHALRDLSSLVIVDPDRHAQESLNQVNWAAEARERKRGEGGAACTFSPRFSPGIETVEYFF